MPHPQLDVSPSPAASVEADALVVGVRSGEDGPVLLPPEGVRQF